MIRNKKAIKFISVILVFVTIAMLATAVFADTVNKEKETPVGGGSARIYTLFKIKK